MFNKRMIEQTVAYPNKGIFLRNKKEWALETRNSMHESQKHHAELRVTRKNLRCVFHSCVIAKAAKGVDNDWKQISGCLGQGLEEAGGNIWG